MAPWGRKRASSARIPAIGSLVLLAAACAAPVPVTRRAPGLGRYAVRVADVGSGCWLHHGGAVSWIDDLTSQPRTGPGPICHPDLRQGCGRYRVTVADEATAGASVHMAPSSDGGWDLRVRQWVHLPRGIVPRGTQGGGAHGGADDEIDVTARRVSPSPQSRSWGPWGPRHGPRLPVAAAGPDPILDVEPDVDTVQVGATVTLTARIFDTDGTTPLTGPATNTQVRFRSSRAARTTRTAVATRTSPATPASPACAR